MKNPVRSRGVTPYLVGMVTALAGAHVFAARSPARVVREALGPQGERGNRSTPHSSSSMAAGYEEQDAKAGSIGWIMVIFAGCAMTGVALMVLMLSLLHHRDMRRETGLTAQQQEQSAPPLPHLQADPIEELAALRARESAKLRGYAWVDANTARIPIERAMTLVMGQSLDAHADPERTH